MKKKIKIGSVINAFILLAFAFTCIYPFMYTISMSLSTQTEAARSGLHLFPRDITFASYEMVINNEDIFTGYKNTIIRTVVGTILTLIVTAMMAYPLSRPNLPFKKFFGSVLVFSMLFSGGTIPNYLLIRGLGLLNNRWVYILPSLVYATNVIIMRSFLQGIPDSLPESARIDGASEMRTLFSIMVPMSKPVFATLGLVQIVSHWNAWFDSMVYISDNSKKVLQIILQRVITDDNVGLMTSTLMDMDSLLYSKDTVKSATIIVTVFPVLVAYPFLQKYFVKGAMIGSLKG